MPRPYKTVSDYLKSQSIVYLSNRITLLTGIILHQPLP